MTAQWKQILWTFGYTGDAQSWRAPYQGYYRFELWGASGSGRSSQYIGGGGGYVAGTTFSNESDLFHVYVGGHDFTADAGIPSPIPSTSLSNPVVFNNGGFSYFLNTHSDTYPSGWMYAGGGSTDIRLVSGTWNNANSLRSRIMVAAGGGGAIDYWTPWFSGGDAGGLIGYSGNAHIYNNVSTKGIVPTGGSQTQGGLNGSRKPIYGGFGIVTVTEHGNSESSSITNSAGTALAGNGWYSDGAGPHAGGTTGSGAGGSSYISGHKGAVGVTSKTDSTPISGCSTGTTTTSCSISPYGSFINTLMIDGGGYAWTNTKGSLQLMPNPFGGYYASGVGHRGSGYTRITWLGDTL